MIQLIVLLYASQHGIDGLRKFESKVIPILREHGGTLISASSKQDHTSNEPDEIHVIQFPSMNEFNAYKNDARVITLRAEKEKMIQKMDLYMTNTFHSYE